MALMKNTVQSGNKIPNQCTQQPQTLQVNNIEVQDINVQNYKTTPPSKAKVAESNHNFNRASVIVQQDQIT